MHRVFASGKQCNTAKVCDFCAVGNFLFCTKCVGSGFVNFAHHQMGNKTKTRKKRKSKKLKKKTSNQAIISMFTPFLVSCMM